VLCAIASRPCRGHDAGPRARRHGIHGRSTAASAS
jgi:hypothetical protein